MQPVPINRYNSENSEVANSIAYKALFDFSAGTKVYAELIQAEIQLSFRAVVLDVLPHHRIQI
jgi:hypothetical protein